MERPLIAYQAYLRDASVRYTEADLAGLRTFLESHKYVGGMPMLLSLHFRDGMNLEGFGRVTYCDGKLRRLLYETPEEDLPLLAVDPREDGAHVLARWRLSLCRP